MLKTERNGSPAACLKRYGEALRNVLIKQSSDLVEYLESRRSKLLPTKLKRLCVKPQRIG